MMLKRIPIILLFAGFLFSCVSNQPNNKLSDLYSNLGDAYFRLEEYKKSVGAFQSALLYDKKNDSLKYNLARAYMMNKQLAEARQIVDELLEKDPDNGILLETKGYILLTKGHTEEAKAIYERILELVPNHLNALYNCYLIYLQEENFYESYGFLEKHYEYAAEKKAEDYRLLAQAADRAGKKELKVSYYEEASKLGDSGSLEYLASYYTGEKEYAKAVSKYEALMKLKDYKFNSYMKLAELLLFYVEDFKKGKEYLKLAKENGQLNLNNINTKLKEIDYLWEDELNEYIELLSK